VHFKIIQFYSFNKGSTVAKKDDLQHLLRLTAKLYYENGLGQEEVARTIGISRTKVSRLLTKAKDLGIVQIRIQGYNPRNHELEEQLQTSLGLKRAIVINIPNQITTAHVRRTIGLLAAPYIADLIQAHNIVGTAGGRTLSELIHNLDTPSKFSSGAILTLMGHIGPTATGIDALELSFILARYFGRTQYTLNAPAFSPDPSTRDVFLNHEQVRSVLDLFSKLEIALVGIGALHESAWIERNVISQDDLAALKLAGAVGEMVGRFFDKNGVECETPYRDRVISIELSKLRELPEVIAVTNGTARGKAIVAASKGNLIKTLVIDEAGARSVLRELQVASRQA
jgi:DNA-binding transcriptional regulator LsrR (DeoR family)